MTYKEAQKLSDIIYDIGNSDSDLIAFYYDPIVESLVQIVSCEYDKRSRGYTFTLEDQSVYLHEEMILEYVIVYRQVQDWLNETTI